MSENPDLLPNPTHEDPFEVQMRGYSRRQVDEFVARSRTHARDLEERLSRSLDEVERLRLELSTARQTASGSKPAHEEVSERIAQILKLAEDEASAQKHRASEEIAQLRAEAQKAADVSRAEAKSQAERMLTAAQEQAERTVAAARSEAEQTRSTARTEAEHTAGNAKKNAEAAVTTAKAQAKQMLDEATARASAIHDGAERRLDLLKNRHTEAMRRLTEIRDVVTDLVSHDNAKGTLDEEVEKTVAATLSGSGGAAKPTVPQAPAKPKPPTPAASPSPGQPPPGTAQHARHAATPGDRPLRQAKPGTPAHGGGPTSGPVSEASPDDVRVIMP
jgi:cell division septum initiation protein DivIVA